MYNSLRRLFSGMINGVGNGMTKDQLQDEARKFLESDEVDRWLRTMMTKLTRRLRKASAAEMRKSLTGSTNSAELYRLIQDEMKGPVGRRVNELIAENVQYIKTVPQFWADYITKYVQRESLKGRRPESIEADLRRVMPNHMTKNLKCICRTETSKANAAIVQARAEAVGIKCYIWRTVGDERVRPSHRAMNGKVVFYSSPPNPEAIANSASNGATYEKPYGAYHAGNTFNCRCWQQVIVDEKHLPSSFDLAMGEEESFMNKVSFLKRFGKIS